jgi:hypothetical protein
LIWLRSQSSGDCGAGLTGEKVTVVGLLKSTANVVAVLLDEAKIQGF